MGPRLAPRFRTLIWGGDFFGSDLGPDLGP
jgi:hypothetical protein